MKTRSAILDVRGNPIRTGGARVAPVRARYDAAQTSEDNYRHWVEADALSARSANSPQVRLKLRNRARYEAANNSYCRGIVQTLANDLIGTGPTLQLTGGDKARNAEVEAVWREWCGAVGLARKLRTMREARAVDGEAFALLIDNPRLRTPVRLDFRLYEAEQVATPFPYPLDPLKVDGIVLDEQFNPLEYHLLRSHPGDDIRWAYGFEFDAIPAELVIHWFQAVRPHQFRGIPDITPALPLFAQLRRYTLAVLAAAETAADFAAVVYSEMAPDGVEADPTQPFDVLEIEKRMMTTLPAGWKMGQFKAEQPVNTYEMFKREILNEIARCLNMPYNIAAGNSSGYNYSSGRLDHQTYYRGIEVDQSDIGCVAVDRLFFAWLEELALVMPELVPARDVSPAAWSHRWLWQGLEHVDPHKEAAATETQLRNYGTSFSEMCYRDGVDPDARARMIADDHARFAALGVRLPGAWLLEPGQVDPTQDYEGGSDAGKDDQGNIPDGGNANGALVHRNGFHRP